MGYPLYFAATNTCPIIPLEVVKATYLWLLPDSVLLIKDLISCQAVVPQKQHEQLQVLQMNSLPLAIFLTSFLSSAGCST
jgi:hypothetical protein